MSVHTIITRGFGSFGTSALVVTRGYGAASLSAVVEFVYFCRRRLRR